MNLLREFLHRPVNVLKVKWTRSKYLRRYEADRARALIAFAEAVKRGDTRSQHDRHAEAKRLTAKVLKLELGK